MKVLHLITGLGMGGAERMLSKIVPLLNNENIVVSLTTNGVFGKKLEEKKIRVYTLDLTVKTLPLAILKFRRIILKEKPDIINSYLIHSNLFARIFGRLFGVKRIICSVRNKHIDKPFLMFLDRITKKLVDVYTPNSETVAKYIIEKQGIPKDKVIVIPNGIRMERFKVKVDRKQKRKELKIKTKHLISCIAKFEQQKGHEYLLKAVAQIKRNDFTLVLVGDGHLFNDMKSLSKSLGIKDKVRFLGKRMDVVEILKASDFTVLPSLYEGMSNVILEAMACKCPILTTNIPENIELVNGDTITVPPKTVKPLANAINKMLDDITFRKKSSEKLYKRVQEYSLEKTLEKLKKVYISLRGGQ